MSGTKRRCGVVPLRAQPRLLAHYRRVSTVEPCWCGMLIFALQSCIRRGAPWAARSLKGLFILSMGEIMALARRLRWARGFDRRRYHRKLRPTRRSNIVARVIQDWTRQRMDSSAPKARPKHALAHATGARTDPQRIGVDSGTLSRPAARANGRPLDCIAAFHRGLCRC